MQKGELQMLEVGCLEKGRSGGRVLGDRELRRGCVTGLVKP